MKVLIINDYLFDCSTYNRAKALKKYITDYEIDIIAGHRNQEQVVPLFPKYDVLHFNYTGKVDSYFEHLKQTNSFDKTVMTVVNERSMLDNFCVMVERFRDMLKSVKYVTTVSRKISEMFGYEYIPNGVDLDIFTVPRNIVAGFIGKTKEEKGFPDFEKVCQELNIQIEQLNAKLNGISHSQMPTWYRSIDVFVHPSKTEGCSNVVLEAMAMNVPVIMNRVGIWQDLEGVTFVEDNKESLYNALREFRDKRIVNTRPFIKSNFSWGDISKKYKGVYDRFQR